MTSRLDSNPVLMDLLSRAGIDRQTAEAAMEIDATVQNWRRKMAKRELGRRALRDLRIDVDLSQLDVLVAIEGHGTDFPGDPGAEETMVATVAERLGIDPSRASRMTSEAVAGGLATRQASQADARRTILVLSDKGRAILAAVRAYRWIVMGDFLKDWSPDERAAFSSLLKRYAMWTSTIDNHQDQLAPHMRALAQDLEKELSVPTEKETG